MTYSRHKESLSVDTVMVCTGLLGTYLGHFCALPLLPFPSHYPKGVI